MLQAAGWNAEAAIDNFYSSPEPAAASGRRRAIEALFDRLKDPQQDDLIQVDGITQFCSELEVSCLSCGQSCTEDSAPGSPRFQACEMNI